MNKITKLSKSGFQLDNESRWFTIDKFKISQDKFSSLEIGNELEDFKLNSKGFVIGFDVRTVLEQDGGIKSLATSSNNESISKESLPLVQVIKKKDGLMYGQAINLAFNNFSHRGINSEYINNSNQYVMIEQAFDLADRLYAEMLKRI